MGEAIVKAERGNEWDAFSAGTEPKDINPFTIKVLQEIGIAVGDLESKNLSRFSDQEFDMVVTLCGGAAESCPFFPGAKKQAHIPFDDPAAAQGSENEILDEFRRVRDEIRPRLIALLDETKVNPGMKLDFKI